jgi:hypothetical protein
MDEIYYKKQGRRYVPVSVYDSGLSSAMREGAHLVIVSPGLTSTLFGINPANAELLAAVKLYQEDIRRAVHEACQIQPGSPYQASKLTPKQKAAWDAYVKTLPKNGSEFHAHYKSLLSVIEAATNELEKRVRYDKGEPRTREDWEVLAKEHNPDILFWDGFDAAIVGFARRCGQPTVLAYSYRKCIDILIERDQTTIEDATEYFEFNTVGGWLGENTPVCVEDL